MLKLWLGFVCFTWPADWSENFWWQASATIITLLWIGSHPILTGAILLRWAFSFFGACIIWVLSQLPLCSGGEINPVWRDSWLPSELSHRLGLPHEDELLLKDGIPGCLQARPVASLWRAGMDDVRSLKAGTWSWTGALRSSLSILCRCSSQPSSCRPSMALWGRGACGGRETRGKASPSGIKLSQ